MPAASRHHIRSSEHGTTTARGYDAEHRKARKAAAAIHSPDDPCARCGHALGPMGPHLHYDHNADRTGYLGFSHGSEPCPDCGKRCNVRAGAIEGNRRQDADPGPRPRRDWYAET